jgi:hypothetical protein
LKSYKCCFCLTKIDSPTIEEMGAYTREKLMRFYGTFVNTIGRIAIRHKGKMFRILGDDLSYYFPQTNDPTNVGVIKSVLECCLKQIERRQSLSEEMTGEQSSAISYSVSADYDTICEPDTGDKFDPNTEFRFTLPPLHKIGLKTPPNTIVLGYDLYNTIKKFPELHDKYSFKSIGEHILDSRKNMPYSLYRLGRKQHLST